MTMLATVRFARGCHLVRCPTIPRCSRQLPASLRTQRRSGFSSKLRCQGSTSSQSVVTPANVGKTLADVCRQLDEFLEKEGDDTEEAALNLATAAKQQGLLGAYGAAQQVPKALYSMEELRLNKIEPMKLLSPVDNSLNEARRTLLIALGAGIITAGFSGYFTTSTLLTSGVTFLFFLTVDQLANSGGLETLVLDTLARVIKPSYRERVSYHEAGHFLIAYLMGILPRAYTLSSLDAFLQYRAFNVQAGCQFCDLDFRRQVIRKELSSQTLGTISCIALAGVVTEYLRYGQAEGGVGDVAQLDGLFRALQFTQAKADGEVRWAVLNVAAILRRHTKLHDKLAVALGQGKSVGECVELIEKELASSNNI